MIFWGVFVRRACFPGPETLLLPNPHLIMNGNLTGIAKCVAVHSARPARRRRSGYVQKRTLQWQREDRYPAVNTLGYKRIPAVIDMHRTQFRVFAIGVIRGYS